MHNSAAVHHAQTATFTNPETPAPPPEVLHADKFDCPSDYRVRRSSGTRDYLITFTLSGEGVYRLDGQDWVCRAGDVMLLEPGTRHDYGTSPDQPRWEFYWAHFTPRPGWAEWLRFDPVLPGLRGQAITDPAVRARMSGAFERLIIDSRGTGVWRDELAANALEEAILCVARQHARSEPDGIDPRVQLAMQWIETHYREPFVVSSLAKHVGLSPSRLAHLFKANAGSGVAEAALRLRLRQAARLLEFTALTVKEISGECGFSSEFYFSRQFKAHYGRSPSLYRKRA